MKKVVAFTTVLITLLALADRLNPVREGLNGAYYANTNWSGAPIATSRDPELSNARLADAWNGAPPERFSAAWTGSLLVMRDAAYAIATLSDDASSVYIDGQVVVDNRGDRSWPRGATGSLSLTRGVHAIRIEYVRDARPWYLEVQWARAGSRSSRFRHGRSRRTASASRRSC